MEDMKIRCSNIGDVKTTYGDRIFKYLNFKIQMSLNKW